MHEDDNEKLDFLNEALLTSRSSSKATYSMWKSCFDTGKGRDNQHTVKAMLAYWLSCFVLPVGPEDGLNSFFFHQAIGEREELSASALILGSISIASTNVWAISYT